MHYNLKNFAHKRNVL